MVSLEWLVNDCTIVAILQWFEQDVVLSNDGSAYGYPISTACVVYAVPSGTAWGYRISVKS